MNEGDIDAYAKHMSFQEVEDAININYPKKSSVVIEEIDENEVDKEVKVDEETRDRKLYEILHNNYIMGLSFGNNPIAPKEPVIEEVGGEVVRQDMKVRKNIFTVQMMRKVEREVMTMMILMKDLYMCMLMLKFLGY
ncbi:conserved hypothetical protein [Ricinus communis]|uniref:Uncharacterized protein n=1 Tax=Ricinus communis TaxID=3988 RepID=B9RPV4_RICCO|nr:conserved hypothetical protein [Ricinus communis]